MSIIALALPALVVAQGSGAFLTNPTDARSAAMGGAGVATAGSAFSVFRNAAQLPVADSRLSAGYTVMSWLPEVSAQYQHTVAVAFKPTARQSVYAGFRHLSYSSFESFDDEGNPLGRLSPRDIAAEIGYARMLCHDFSASLTARYLRLDLGWVARNAVSFDLGLFYRHRFASGSPLGAVSAGVQLADFGTSPDFGGGRRPLPWRVKAGGAVDLHPAEHHLLTLTAECEYLFRPAALRAWSGSFGAEYRCFSIASLRGGYHLGDRSGGGWRYGTVGAGVQWRYVGVDAAYFIASRRCPLRNTWLLSLHLNILPAKR